MSCEVCGLCVMCHVCIVACSNKCIYLVGPLSNRRNRIFGKTKMYQCFQVEEFTCTNNTAKDMQLAALFCANIFDFSTTKVLNEYRVSSILEQSSGHNIVPHRIYFFSLYLVYFPIFRKTCVSIHTLCSSTCGRRFRKTVTPFLKVPCFSASYIFINKLLLGL